MLNGLDLFTGIGGITLALSEWVQPVAYCENDRYAQGVLLSRMREGSLPMAPIWDDVRSLCGRDLPTTDIIYGGFPCQDISVAGTGAGLAGERSGLFFEIIRLTRECRPSFVFLENVPAITVRGLDRVLLEFTALGYDCRWTIVSAEEMGAAHLRERWFLLAYSNGDELRLQSRGRKRKGGKETLQPRGAVEVGALANTNSQSEELRQAKGWEHNPFSVGALEGDNWDDYAAYFLRVGDGLPNRLDRVKALGNAVVPVQAREAFMRLVGLN